MKQLSTLGGRRHVFFRGQRRMRALGERLEAEELGHFSYYGGELRFGGVGWIIFLTFKVDCLLMIGFTRMSIKCAFSD